MEENNGLINVGGEVEVEGAGAANEINEEIENVERVEAKLDRALLYITSTSKKNNITMQI